MITVTPSRKVFVSLEPLDFRKGFNGTAGACRKLAGESHLSGATFLFFNRRKTMIRAYTFDGYGEYLLNYRISKGRLKWWDKQPDRVIAADIAAIFSGAGPVKGVPDPWKKLA